MTFASIVSSSCSSLEDAVINADWVMLYEFDTAPSEHSDFPHCLGIALRKKDHHAMQIKILMNEEGLNNKDKYLQAALKTLRYGDTPLVECVEMEKKVHSEGIYPKKKRVCHGITFSAETK